MRSRLGESGGHPGNELARQCANAPGGLGDRDGPLDRFSMIGAARASDHRRRRETSVPSGRSEPRPSSTSLRSRRNQSASRHSESLDISRTRSDG
jgi:hypothetical protein